MRQAFCTLLIFSLISCASEKQDQKNHRLAMMESFLDKNFADCPTGGVVLVSQEGNAILTKAFGFANVELDLPMEVDHVLAIGSITKQFTAVMILKLVGEGKISLEDVVHQYVPELGNQGKRITIEQVLTHTSGLYNFVDLPDFDEITTRYLSPLEILNLTRDYPLSFEPGTKYRYSDSGYILLGMIIERISGMTYAEYLENVICRPIDMHNTWYPDDKRIIPKLVKGYSVEGKNVIHANYIHMSIPYSAGAIYSSAEDLLIWCNALKSGRIVSDTLLQKAWTSAVLKDGTETGYGFGWDLCSIAGKATREHGGFLNGFNARLLEIPEEDIVICVLVNNDADIPEPGFVARGMARIFLSGHYEPDIIRSSSEALKKWTGTYISISDTCKVYLSDDTLYFQRNGRTKRQLWPVSNSKFTFDDADDVSTISFLIESDNQQRVTLSIRHSCELDFFAQRLE